MVNAVDYLKDKLLLKGKQWVKTQDREYMNDILALIQAINVLEERLYEKEITDITVLL